MSHDASVTTTNPHSGTYAGQINATATDGNGSIEQVITGLTPNTGYMLTGWVRTDGGATFLGAKLYDSTGGSADASTTNTGWTQLTDYFKTGASGTSVDVYCYRPSVGASACDDISLQATSAAVANTGFENGNLQGWSMSHDASVTTTNPHSGTYAGQINATATDGNGSIEQVITGLTPNTGYMLTGWVRTDGGATSLGAKLYDSAGGVADASTTNTGWTQLTDYFKTGASGTSVDVYCYRPSVGASACDDISLQATSAAVANTGFENGNLQGWSMSHDASVTTTNPHSGTYAGQINATATDGNGSIEQVITGLTPNTGYMLTGWVRTDGGATSLGAKLYDSAGGIADASTANTGWTQLTDYFKTGASGTSVDVYCYRPSVGASACDDISLQATSAAVANTGFENGNLQGWSMSHDASVTTTNPHTGTYAGQINATPTDGDGSIEQVITGLTPNTGYMLTGWVRTDGGATFLGAKLYDSAGSIADASTTNTGWTQLTDYFKTGSSGTSVDVYCYRPSVGASACDDISLQATSAAVANTGFENGNLQGWSMSHDASVTTTNPHSGTYAGQINATATDGNGSIEQVISGLTPNTGYLLTGWVRTDGGTTFLGAKGYDIGGGTADASTTNTGWTQLTDYFKTGSSGTSVDIYCYRPSVGASACDDITLAPKFVGATGAMLFPDDQSQTSSVVTLQAAVPGSYSGTTFLYRVGASGSFTTIPASDVSNGSGAVSWPVSTSTNSAGVQTGAYTWNLTRTLASDGPVQIEAQFTDGQGHTDTTPPVTVTLNRLGNGTDFGTTMLGPVSVGLQSGNAALSAGDVQIASYRAGLGVSRTFNTLAPNTPSAFGLGWTASLPVLGTSASWASLTDDASYVQLMASDGSLQSFLTGATTNGVTAYAGQGDAANSGLTLTKSSSGFLLVDATGTQVSFTVPDSTKPTVYAPGLVTQPGTNKSIGYTYSGGKLQLISAPDPAVADNAATTAACAYPVTSTGWSAGCRGMVFKYDAATGNVSEVDFVAVDNTAGFEQIPVAQYSYDGNGRLLAEWDPRISPALKNQYSYDSNGRLASVTPAQDPATGNLKPYTFTYDNTAGDIDYGKLLSVTRSHTDGTAAVQSVLYHVPITKATGGPIDMDAGTIAAWGQSDLPTSAVAEFPADHVPGTSPDYTWATIHYYDANGRETNTATYGNGWNITTTEYDANGNFIRQLSATNREAALASNVTGVTTAAMSRQLDTENIYSSDGTELLDSYGPMSSVAVAGYAAPQQARQHTHYVYDEGAPNSDKDANGNPFRLVTTTVESASLGATIPGTVDTDARTSKNVYAIGSDASGWTLKSPLQTVTDPSGLAITQTTRYNTNASLYGGEPLVVSASQPSDTAGTGAGTGDSVYYTAGANSVDASCGNQPNWANLLCETEPAAQPGTAGLPNLAVTKYTYNTLLEPLTKVEDFGSGKTRTTTTTYDTAGRAIRSSTTTTGTGMGTAIPDTVMVYSPATGMATDQESVDASNNVTADLKSGYDEFGQMTSYTDADGNTTTYTYDIAGRGLTRNDGKGTTTMAYNGGSERRGLPTSETDSQAGAFTAAFDADGNLVSETYPGGTVGTYAFDAAGSATSLTYSNPNWSSPLQDSVTTSIHGEWANRTVLNSSQSYSYDAGGRLSSAKDTQAGVCTTRSYGYDVDSNRLSLATSAAGAGGACQSTTSTSQSYSYDSADRLTDTGYVYDAAGRILTTPSADAGGTGDLSATYAANDMLVGQSQGTASRNLTLDPYGKRYRTSTDTGTGVVTTYHYASETDSPSWTADSTGTWTRDILGLNGQLGATASSNGTTSISLVSLHGDVMATASASTTATGPTATYTYNEFGAVESGNPGALGWLGGGQRSQALGGQILMGARMYNTQTGRFAQVDPVPGGSANRYDYAGQQPTSRSDMPGTRWSWISWGSNWWFRWFDIHLDEYSTRQLIDTIWDASGVMGVCWAAGAIDWITIIGAGVSATCGLVGSVLALGGFALSHIDDAGHNRGIYFELDFYRQHYWWWGWHEKDIPCGGYVWHN